MTEPHPLLITVLHEQRATSRLLETVLARLDAIEARLSPAPGVAPAEADPVGRLRMQCDRDGIPIAGDHISEGAAARLLGVSKDTMQRRRYEGRPVVRTVKFLGRYRCALIDVAEKLSAGIEEIDE